MYSGALHTSSRESHTFLAIITIAKISRLLECAQKHDELAITTLRRIPSNTQTMLALMSNLVTALASPDVSSTSNFDFDFDEAFQIEQSRFHHSSPHQDTSCKR